MEKYVYEIKRKVKDIRHLPAKWVTLKPKTIYAKDKETALNTIHGIYPELNSDTTSMMLVKLKKVRRRIK